MPSMLSLALGMRLGSVAASMVTLSPSWVAPSMMHCVKKRVVARGFLDESGQDIGEA